MFRFFGKRHQIKLYNSLSNKKEFFSPRDGRTAKLYTCGPTVYSFAHIGNLRTYIFEDILRRTIELSGYKVVQVMNITDIDDKIIKTAIASKKSLKEITLPFEKTFFEDLAKLNIEAPEKTPRATDYIKSMIGLIETLVEKGFAYQGEDGSVYFSIAKFKNYGKLSRPNINNNKNVLRTELDEYEKDEVKDFALWKAKKEGEPFWNSPWGEGRPGWHIECSAMALEELGNTLDIHTGGVDNIFPHHENEIAQSEAATGNPFSRFFMHGEHLLVDGAKMAKSAGNFYTIRDIEEKGYEPLSFRYLCLQTHYRSKMNFTWESLHAASLALKKLRQAAYSLKNEGGTKNNEQDGKEIFNALRDDLNAPKALASLWGGLKSDNLSAKEKKSLIGYADRALGLNLLESIKNDRQEIPDEIRELANERENLRKKGDFFSADGIRKRLEEKGYEVIDGKGGYELIKK
jgi:cysteinyl-tRNA synthetase